MLAKLPDGSRDIALYYALAPLIVEAIRERRAERELVDVYFTHILPAVLLARLGAARLARMLYRDLVVRLCRRYVPEVAGLA